MCSRRWLTVGFAGGFAVARRQQMSVVTRSVDDLVKAERAVSDLAQELAVGPWYGQRDAPGRRVFDRLDSEAQHVHRVLLVVSVGVDELGMIDVATAADAEQSLSLGSGTAEEPLFRSRR